MAKGNTISNESGVVRIWNDAKQLLPKLQEAMSEKEQRPVSEAELVSKSVKAFYQKEKRKLGIA